MGGISTAEHLVFETHELGLGFPKMLGKNVQAVHVNCVSRT